MKIKFPSPQNLKPILIKIEPKTLPKFMAKPVDVSSSQFEDLLKNMNGFQKTKYLKPSIDKNPQNIGSPIPQWAIKKMGSTYKDAEQVSVLKFNRVPDLREHENLNYSSQSPTRNTTVSIREADGVGILNKKDSEKRDCMSPTKPILKKRSENRFWPSPECSSISSPASKARRVKIRNTILIQSAK